METLASEPANADNNASVETGEVDSNPVAAEGADPAPAAADTGKPPRDRVQERIDTLTREKYEALGGRDSERYRREQLEQEIAQLRQQQAKPETVAPSNEFPTLESYDFDEQKFHKAVAEFYTKQTGEVVQSELARERQAAQRIQTQKDWERRQGEYIKAKPDYAQKVGNLPPSLMTDSLAAEIKASDMGPEVAYYLAENMEKLAAIAQLPPSSQAREIGRIEARLEAAKAAPPPVSKAPPPPQKIEAAESTSGAVSTTDPASDKLSDDAWVKAERAREAKRARRAL